MAGIASNNLTPASTVSELIANGPDGTRRIDVPAFAAQLVGQGLIPSESVVNATWTGLAAVTGTRAGQGAEVLDSDTGTHTDPVVGGTVPNSGRFQWSVTPPGWKRIGGTGLSAKANQTALDAEIAARAAAVEAIQGVNVIVDPFHEYLGTSPALLNNAVSQLFSGTYLATSANSPWNKGSIAATGSTNASRRIALSQTPFKAGDAVRWRAGAHFAGSGGTVQILARNAGGSVLLSTSATGLVSGFNDVNINQTIPSGTDHFVIQCVLASSDKELVAVAASPSVSKPAFVQAFAPGLIGISKRAHNLAPDPFWRLHAAGLTSVDGYSIPSGCSVVTLAASPFAGKKALLIPAGQTARDRFMLSARTGLKLGDKVTLKAGYYTANAQTIQFGGFFRNASNATVGSVSTVSRAFAAGEYFELSKVITVDQTLLDTAVRLDLRLVNTALGSDVHVCGVGVFVGDEDPILADLEYVEDEMRLQIAALQATAIATPARYGSSHLRNWRLQYARLRTGVATQIVYSAIGDSLTQARDRYVKPLLDAIQQHKFPSGNAIGDGGLGWIGFGVSGSAVNGNAKSTVNYTRTGTWDLSTYFGTLSPDLGEITSSTAGSRAILVFPSGPTLSQVQLLAKATGNGVARYSWDGGSTWTTITIAGAAGDLYTQNMSVGMPTSAGTLWIEVVSGTVTLCGLNPKSATSGFIMHKLGATGSSSVHWESMLATAQGRAAFATLGSTLTSICLGTNDSGGSVSAANYESRIRNVYDGVKLATPATDVLLIAPAQTPRVTSVPLSAYQDVLYKIAQEKKCGFINLQNAFGPDPAAYAYNGPFPLIIDDNSNTSTLDDIHWDPATGGLIVTEEIARMMLLH